MVDHNPTTLFNDIYDSTNSKILSYITAKCGNVSDINDIFQDTYMELYRAISKRGPDYIDNSEAFVMKIAKQKVYHYYSLLERLKKIIPMNITSDEGEETSHPDLEIFELSAEEKAVDTVCIDELQGLISKKSIEIQKIFHLFYSLDLTIPEIAKLMSISESNVKNKLYRTIRELRKLYFGKDYKYDE